MSDPKDKGPSGAETPPPIDGDPRGLDGPPPYDGPPPAEPAYDGPPVELGETSLPSAGPPRDPSRRKTGGYRKRSGAPDRRAPQPTRESGFTEPVDVAAEQAVLGAVLLDSDVMQTVGNLLKAEDFYRESHRAIYRAMLALNENNQTVDTVTLSRELRKLDLLTVAGGGSYIAELGSRVPTAINAKHYANIVQEKATQRRVIAFGRETIQDAQGELEDVGKFVDEVAKRALDLSIGGPRAGVVHIREALGEAVENVQKLLKTADAGGLSGVSSGFHDLDKKTNGWQRGELIILAARPGMGKTAFALNALSNAARDQRGPQAGVFFSLEMTKEQVASRIWASLSRVSISGLRSGQLDEKDWGKLWPAVEELHDVPLYVDDTPGLSITELMRKCRQLKHEADIQLIMIDYLQLMTGSGSRKNGSREQEISEISRTLKVLAKELNVPVIALSQLNRGVESRTDKRPMLSDLRESGAIEQDADIIIFLYRDDYYEQMKGNPGGGAEGDDGAVVQPDPLLDSGHSISEVIIAKNRSGPTGKVELNFEKAYTLFSNIGHGPPPIGDGMRPPGIEDDHNFPPPTPMGSPEDFAMVDFEDDFGDPF